MPANDQAADEWRERRELAGCEPAGGVTSWFDLLRGASSAAPAGCSRFPAEAECKLWPSVLCSRRSEKAWRAVEDSEPSEPNEYVRSKSDMPLRGTTPLTLPKGELGRGMSDVAGGGVECVVGVKSASPLLECVRADRSSSARWRRLEEGLSATGHRVGEHVYPDADPHEHVV